MTNPPEHAPLQAKVNEYQAWRDGLAHTISSYRDWLSRSPYSDALIELRLYDILDALKRDQLVLAFLAEFSRGKTETINALFFSDFNQRLLPSEAGRTTMCPTEIFWDPREEPSIKLLPIATRQSDDTLNYLKTTPNAWRKFKLNIDSPDEMKATLLKLTDQIEVSQPDAEAVGLWNSRDSSMVNDFKLTGKVKIPAWRHAMINFPHPLLKSGLVVIDTPGLNTLGAEPELTLSIAPSAHAVLFLTATDTGITKSDMDIWDEYIKGRAKYKLVLLNKIDVLWDELRTEQDVVNSIDRQVNMTAHQLGVAPEHVFAISAQKALVARIKKDATLLKQSRILQLEAHLGNQLIQAKHEIMGRTVTGECGEMIKNSRKLLQQRVASLREQVLELRNLRGQNADASKALMAKVMSERKRYEDSIPTFNQANDKIGMLGKKLLRHLSINYLDSSIAESRQQMGDSWTTVGLNQGMRNMMKQSVDLANDVTEQTQTIKRLANNIYKVFQTKHGYDIFDPPALDMSEFLNNIRAMQKITDDFCKDPINMMTEKHFLIRKFYLGLGTQKQILFEQAGKDVERWLQDVMTALTSQMAQHKASLDERTKNLTQARASAEALDSQLAIIEKEYAQISKESQNLDTMLLRLMTAVKPAVKANIADKSTFGADKTMRMPTLQFVNTPASQAKPS